MKPSIHTFELSIHCSRIDFIKFHTAISQYNQDSVPRLHYPYKDYQIKIYSYTCLRSRGINRVIFKEFISPDNIVFNNVIQFVINPLHLIECNNHSYTTIIDYNKLDEVSDRLNNLLHELCPDFPDINDLGKLSRVDYCLNYWLTSQREVKKYFNLINKANIPSRLTKFEYFDKTSRRRTGRKGELTLKCRSYELSLYLKHTQMKNSDYTYPESELSNSEGQLRIELRSNRKHLYTLKQRGQYSDEMDLLFITKPFELIQRNLKSMYGTGDFYCLEEAKEIVNSSSCKQPTKEHLLHILETVNDAGTIPLAKCSFEENYIAKHMKYFNRLNLSPITVPKNSIHNRYPNPIKYITGESTDYLRATDSP